MNRISRLNILILISILLQTSCSDIPVFEREQAFSQIFDINDVNSSIILEANPYLANHSFQRPTFSVTLKNLSNEYLIFAFNYGIQIYHYDEDRDKWIVIADRLRYVSDHDKVIGPFDGEQPSLALVLFQPDLELFDYPFDIRVTVIGNVYLAESGMGRQVGAFIDLHLDPN